MTVVDPTTTWVDSDVVLERDVTILPGVQLLGATVVAEDAVVGPDCTLKDVEVGRGAKVVRTHGELAVIGEGATVGPFSYLRPGTELGAGGKIGGFVETKNARIGDGAKVPHLSYVGDAEIGEGTNIGAGTIFANYDGVTKHRTRSAARRGPARTTRSSPRSRSATAPRRAAGPSYAATSRPARWRCPPVRSARSRTGRCASAAGHPDGRGRRVRARRRATSHTDGSQLEDDPGSEAQSE